MNALSVSISIRSQYQSNTDLCLLLLLLLECSSKHRHFFLTVRRRQKAVVGQAAKQPNSQLDRLQQASQPPVSSFRLRQDPFHLKYGLYYVL